MRHKGTEGTESQEAQSFIRHRILRGHKVHKAHANYIKAHMHTHSHTHTHTPFPTHSCPLKQRKGTTCAAHRSSGSGHSCSRTLLRTLLRQWCGLSQVCVCLCALVRVCMRVSVRTCSEIYCQSSSLPRCRSS
jgi:hypothetical protein